ncbi:NFX1-type zinc finger-containing protein 1-like [Trichogramma pretiosum]|uniref:NFX1-type zinc finger-containing protein 1-like n=1 Tax=Trichogramma pretiosum TaxID=7493 RepID=UPI000C71B37B|nr:NFX1-type zinc finger-containing protein 1-like [Trichogramma pretiosum]XP_023318072.1 NFX1-type zinc finger-containing protein 1-like [Trichogramma pretiosum]
MYDEEDPGPSEDFRDLSITPNVDDLYGPPPFLRPIQNKEPYDSVEHYLDVQFRLLREDFFQPLRNGLRDYIEADKKKFRSSDVRLYTKVKLLLPDYDKSGEMGIKLFFGKNPNSKIDWKTSKRFMYHGLLMLSHDNFQSILFATVIERDIKMLQNGFVLVEPSFEEDQVAPAMYKHEYVMLESKVYFEPYLEVLKALQRFNKHNFPMIRHLVDATSRSFLPYYLSNIDHLNYNRMSLPIGQKPWPTPRQLKFDESQFKAFKHALTEELAIIQGPPGTGKTFIALEIVRTLIQNKKLWRYQGPLLVVCYTNHALDQFLEGIISTTKSIVRIGSKCKTEALQPYTLQSRREKTPFKDRSEEYNNNRQEWFNTKRELQSLMTEIAEVNADIKYLSTLNSILPKQFLMQWSNDRYLQSFPTNEHLISWLCNDTLPNVFRAELSRRQTKLADPGAYVHEHEEYEPIYIDNSNLEPIFPLDIINERLTSIDRELFFAPKKYDEDSLPYIRSLLTEEKLELNSIQQFLKHQFNLNPALQQSEYKPIENQRWRTYWTWVKRSYNNALDYLTKLELEIREKRAELNDLRQIVDLDVLKEYDIVGLTTTAAARLQSTLRKLKSPIVLVEEAAEIFEAHVLCTLTNHCRHLIMIGDHKQLRPKPAVYELGIKYKLNLSLFERMVNIRGNCNQLSHQHRMRPEISKLITPSIYNTLYDHISVKGRPNIKGMVKNLFFLHHSNHEKISTHEDSWSNEHEAKFLIAFADYLVKQEYSTKDITVLCTYTGQMFALRQEIQNYSNLKDLYVTTVDNFQGEENKIILLSLVRNNDMGNIGFLKEENRVCVALSRARDGMYIMGNMNDLLVKNNIWPKIKQALIEQNAYGENLQVRCQIHADQTTLVKAAYDFKKCPLGGCLEQCNTDLSCGHVCTEICHVFDRAHKLYKCPRKCKKACPNNHPCPLDCWEKCPPCQVRVERCIVKCDHTVKMKCSDDVSKFRCYIQAPAILPDCHHEVQKPCFISVDKYKCPIPCDNRLPCGHACSLCCHVTNDPDHLEYKCTKPCAKTFENCNDNHPCNKKCFEECGQCTISVSKKRSCGHFYKNIPCSTNLENIACQKNCQRKLNCNHQCRLLCHEDCKCHQMVFKKSSCGHLLKLKCFEEAESTKCNEMCKKKLDTCQHPCRNRCKDPCTLKCQFLQKLEIPGLCGHPMVIPCHLQKNDDLKLKQLTALKYCEQPCDELLECGHKCKGTCSQCNQGRIHISCQENCPNILICGHSCQIPCRFECQPCNKPCEVKCKHSKCNKKCGAPCVSCKEKCNWGCKHRKCTKRCGQLCNVEPCMEPCDRKLQCGHPCVGFCGDPCPPLCRVCNKEELETILFGKEDEPDARFVFLEDCNHCIESEALMRFMQTCDSEITLKVCPRCKTPIKSCMRIMNYVKTHLQDVITVKRKFFHNDDKSLKNLQLEIYEKLQSLEYHHNLRNMKEWKNLIASMKPRACTQRRGGRRGYSHRIQELSSPEINSFGAQVNILYQIVNILSTIEDKGLNDPIQHQVLLIVDAIPENWVTTKQILNDIQRELRRLEYMVKIYSIDYLENKKFDIAKEKLSSIQKFTPEFEKEFLSGVQDELEQLAERKMIFKAMAREIKLGAWYKCPNGHIYSIGECGQAMQESKCPDCGSRIGGSNHLITVGNTVATEMHPSQF